MKRIATTLATAAAAFLVSCGPETITLPDPPMAAETQQLVALYDMPTATLDTSNIDQARADAQARLAELNLDWLPGVVSDLLARLRTRLDAGSLPTDPASEPKARRAQVTAVAELHRICAGWDNPASAPDEATNGALDLTAIVDTGKINAEAWATASACRVRFPPPPTAAAPSSLRRGPSTRRSTGRSSSICSRRCPATPRTPSSCSSSPARSRSAIDEVGVVRLRGRRQVGPVPRARRRRRRDRHGRNHARDPGRERRLLLRPDDADLSEEQLTGQAILASRDRGAPADGGRNSRS